MVILATAATVYLRVYHQLNVVYSHFFYIPVVLTAYWFGAKGIFVGIYLSILVFISPLLEENSHLNVADTARAVLMFLISLLTARMAETIKAQTEKLKVSEEFYKTVFESTGLCILVCDEDTTIVFANQQFERFSGLNRSQIEGKMSWKEFFMEEDLERLLLTHYGKENPKDFQDRVIEAKFISGDDLVRDVLVTLSPVIGTTKTVMSIQDITPLKQLKEERDSLSKRLEEALTKVLSGFIPICASCKKIRVKSGEWVPVESYITERSEAKFSHGICPECKEKLYGRFLSGSKDKGEKGG